MKKNKFWTTCFIIVFFVLIAMMLRRSLDNYFGPSKKENSSTKTVLPIDKEANELGISAYDIDAALKFTPAEEANIRTLAKTSQAKLALQNELDSSKVSHLVYFQKELDAYVKKFDQLDDLQLYSLMEEKQLVNGTIERNVYKLSKNLGYHENNQKELVQEYQSLEQKLQEKIEASKTACQSIANPAICNKLLSIIQLIALDQLAVSAQIQDQESLQTKLKEYLASVPKNIYDKQYIQSVTNRLYQLKDQILTTNQATQQQALLENYIRLKGLLQAKKIGISDTELTALIKAHQQAK